MALSGGSKLEQVKTQRRTIEAPGDRQRVNQPGMVSRQHVINGAVPQAEEDRVNNDKTNAALTHSSGVSPGNTRSTRRVNGCHSAGSIPWLSVA